jgi:glutamate--cysteine ligase
MANEPLPAVPHLTTALTGPLLPIERQLLPQQAEIERWFRAQWLETPAPFYCSVDLRNAGFKLAAVDTNLFPAGFNNLKPAFYPLCVQAIQFAVERHCPKAARILIVPESHTRNVHYHESLATLGDILRLAGFEVRIGSLRPDLHGPTTVELPSGRSLRLEPLIREDNRLKTADYSPCLVLLNNDLSAGRPPILEGLEQPVAPPLALGWSSRLKSNHFAHYQRVAREFAALAGLDPWRIDPIFRKCGKINFHHREGEDCLVENVQAVLAEVQHKYREHGIEQTPFVIVKADAGTYGMNIMTVRTAEEVRELNRKQRTKMAVGKEGHAVSEVMVQEGVYTFETWAGTGAVAEPVVYMIDRFVVGGFYRTHTHRGRDENLNAPGMDFQPLAFAEAGACPDPSCAPEAGANRFYTYGVIARLALVAAARELKEVQGPESGVGSPPQK